MARTGKCTVTFRLPSTTIEAVVDGHAHVVRGKIRDAMKRFQKNQTPKSLGFTDLRSGRKFTVQLAAIETWKVKTFYG